MSPQAEGPRMPEEARRAVAWQRLIEASLRHGYEILAQEENDNTKADPASQAGDRLSANDREVLSNGSPSNI